jgi:ABC-type dipeptide/oligopeptide/nickel transport system permease component
LPRGRYGHVGPLAAMRHGGWADQSIMVLALVGLSVPEFWLA